jgi:glycosyltransferase involved in cell wall biosynthesis
MAVLSRGDSQLGTSRSAWKRAAKYLPYRALMRLISAHLYVGANNRAYLQHYGVPESRLFFAPHFVDAAFFAERAAAARASGHTHRLREALAIDPGVTIFAFAGKLIPKKRPLDLLQALGALTRAGHNVCGLFIGSGPLQAELEQEARRHDISVRFAGFRNQSEMPLYLSLADALVLPSDAGETWGLVVNEAMACGVPAIVSTAVGCGPDLIGPGPTGFRYPTGDIAALASAMQEMQQLLSRNRATVVAALQEKTSRYSCAMAVDGVLQALTATAGNAPTFVTAPTVSNG